MEDFRQTQEEYGRQVEEATEAYLNNGIDGLHQKLAGLDLFDPVGGRIEIVLGLSPATFNGSPERKALAVGEQFVSALRDVKDRDRVRRNRFVRVRRVVIEKAEEGSYSSGYRFIDEE